jgi:hybrid polyketide synthase/nonribosomal peptide synthetase ACE1
MLIVESKNTAMYIAESNLNMLSATGRSRMWDAGADGYARGEGVAAVVLKTLSAALADGDDIECLIRETGVNQDGRTTGITMPSATAQAALIRETYAKAGLDLKNKADRCQYFEAHGTGTKAGDPQEAGAIYRAFFAETGVTDPEDILYVGSIKTIIGHTEGTAGLAGVIKASLAIQNKTIPPNMHFYTLNPDIQEYYDHLKVPTSAIPWPETVGPRRVSVNSFGMCSHFSPHELHQAFSLGGKILIL